MEKILVSAKFKIELMLNESVYIYADCIAEETIFDGDDIKKPDIYFKDITFTDDDGDIIEGFFMTRKHISNLEKTAFDVFSGLFTDGLCDVDELENEYEKE